jgi:FkbM family methyltransferase
MKVLWNNWTQTKNSYAQHEEDRLIELLLPRGVNSFIDIGANDGVLFSNSFKFAKKGADGLCIEPSRNSFRKLRLNHLFHPKVKCIQSAVSNTNSHIFLNEDGYESTLSYVSKSKKNNSYSVRCQTFDKILEKYPEFSEVDLLTVDVEGHEKEVFETLTNKYFRAKIIVIESNKSEIKDLINLHSLTDYEAHFFNGVNTVLLNKHDIFNKIGRLPKGFIKC